MATNNTQPIPEDKPLTPSQRHTLLTYIERMTAAQQAVEGAQKAFAAAQEAATIFMRFCGDELDATPAKGYVFDQPSLSFKYMPPEEPKAKAAPRVPQEKEEPGFVGDDADWAGFELSKDKEGAEE